MKLGVIGVLLSMLLAANSFAGSKLHEGDDAIITWINIEPAVIRIGFDHVNKLNPHLCDNLSAVILQINNEYDKALYSTILAAKLTGKKVSLYGTGCVHLWGQDYPVLKAIYVYD